MLIIIKDFSEWTQSILSQDTLNYRFFPPIKIQMSDDLSDKSDTVDLDPVVGYYYINDSIFIIKGTFDLFPTEKSSYQFQFKKDNNLWFMKYEADWKVFFNGIEEVCGSWEMLDNVEMNIYWKKTTVLDFMEEVYTLTLRPLHDDNNPLIEEEQIDEYTTHTIRTIIMFSDAINAYYFTSTSGIIAFITNYGVHIREDKLYLRDILENYWQTEISESRRSS